MAPDGMEIRQVRREDYRVLVQAIAETWGYYKRYKSPRIARLVSRAYWYAALMDHTFSAAAVLNGQCAGVLLGRCNKQRNCHEAQMRRYRLHFIALQILLFFSSQARAYLAGSEKIEQADQKMLEALRRRFDGELVFFILRKEYRRRGIGSALLDAFLEYMQKSGCRDFYVFTDEYCDVAFYDRKGFLRVGEEKVDLPHRAAPSHFYLYQYRIPHLPQKSVSKEKQ